MLYTRLSTGNFPSFADETGTFQGDLSFAQPEDNDISLEVLYYTFSVGNRTEVLVGTAGVESDEFANTVSVLDGDGGSGAITNFGTRSPIYPEGDAALGFIHRFNDLIELNAGYLAEPANEPTSGSGLFNGPFSALGQLVFTPTDNLTFALTYNHTYKQSDTETGSSLANLQSFTASDEFPDGTPTVADSYGGVFSWQIADKFILGGWASFSKVTALSTLDNTIDRGTQDIWQWAATFAFPDVIKEGNMAGIIVGMEPWVTASSINTLGDDDDTSVHVEAFFEYQINDNIAITPGIVWVTSPDNNSNNDDLVIGAIRTTFSF